MLFTLVLIQYFFHCIFQIKLVFVILFLALFPAPPPPKWKSWISFQACNFPLKAPLSSSCSFVFWWEIFFLSFWGRVRWKPSLLFPEGWLRWRLWQGAGSWSLSSDGGPVGLHISGASYGSSGDVSPLLASVLQRFLIAGAAAHDLVSAVLLPSGYIGSWQQLFGLRDALNPNAVMRKAQHPSSFGTWQCSLRLFRHSHLLSYLLYPWCPECSALL